MMTKIKRQTKRQRQKDKEINKIIFEQKVNSAKVLHENVE